MFWGLICIWRGTACLAEYQPGEAADGLMKRADKLPCQAEAAGRNCVRAA
ncbi:MAG: hypothetical protein JW718_11385 [Desulfovibrionaceae bacterium]|nr:hypothetical protein [Desulfovibrionaceae bacterium]